jgi:hypothetical protein
MELETIMRKVSLKRPTITYCRSFLELRPKMMMRIMGHDCVGVWGREQLKGRGKGILSGEEVRGSCVYAYEDSITETSKHC